MAPRFDQLKPADRETAIRKPLLELNSTLVFNHVFDSTGTDNGFGVFYFEKSESIFIFPLIFEHLHFPSHN